MQINAKQRNIIFIGVIFILSTVFWSGLCGYAKKILIYPDELYYLDTARNFFQGNGFLIHNIPSVFQKILYSLFIIPAFLFTSHMKAITWINAIVMSSTVFPAYFLARKIISRDRLVYMIVILVVTLPTMLNCQYVMSEVSFYPVSMWALYFVYCFFEAEEQKKKIIYSVVSGVWFYLAYLNKEVALYFFISYGVVFFLSCFVFHLEEKKDILFLVVTYMVFVVLFVVCKVTVFKGMGQPYSQQDIAYILAFDKLVSLGYYMLYNLCYAIIGFGVVTIFVPMVSLDRTDKKIWKMTLFLLGAFIVACATITYTISVRENFGWDAVRVHLRYIEPMIIPFLILTIAFFEKREYKIEAVVYRKLTRIFVVFSLIFVLIVNQMSTIGILDYSVLKVYEVAITGVRRLAQHFGTLMYIEEVGLNLIRVMVIVCSFAGIYLLCHKGKVGIKVVLAFFFLVNIVNVILGYHDNKARYMITKEQEQQAIQADAYLGKLDGNVVFVSKSGLEDDNKLIDTYINCPFFVTGVDLMIEYGYLEDGCVDLVTEKLISDLPYTPYNISSADYVLISDGVMVNKEKLDKMDDFQLDGYSLYKNSDPSKIFVQPFFPVQPGATVDVFAEDNVLCSSPDLPEKYSSTAEGQAIVYGPYQKIYKGKYEITLEYSCNQEVSGENCVGSFELGRAGADNFVEKDFFLDDGKMVLENVEITEDTDLCEVRIISKVEGLKFEAIHIKRIA